MIERNENVQLNNRPYLSIKDKFYILEKKSKNMRESVQLSIAEADNMSESVTELVNVIDSTPSIFYHNSLDEIKNKEDQINKSTLYQNNENSR